MIFDSLVFSLSSFYVIGLRFGVAGVVIVEFFTELKGLILDEGSHVE